MTFEAALSIPQNKFYRLLQTSRLEPQEIAARTEAIYRDMLAESRYLKQGNFTSIETADLKRMFEKYDRAFFEGQCGELTSASNTLRFRLSPA